MTKDNLEKTFNHLAKKAVNTADIDLEIVEEDNEGMVVKPVEDPEFPFSSVKCHELLEGLTDFEKTHVKARKTTKGISLIDRSQKDREETEPRDFWEIPGTQQGKREQARQMKIEQEVMKQ